MVGGGWWMVGGGWWTVDGGRKEGEIGSRERFALPGECEVRGDEG